MLRNLTARGLWCGSAAARLLGIPGSNPSGGMFVSVSCECFQVQVSASGRSSVVQRSPTECGVSECDRKASVMRPLAHVWVLRPMGREWVINQ